MTQSSDMSAPQSKQPDTVFISYARDDDVKPPFDDSTEGWVTFFWRQLRHELITRGAPQASLWLDRYQIDPAEAFTPKIRQALMEAKILIAVFSENWVQRAWCQEEVSWYGQQNANAGERIVPVYKSNLRQELVPDCIKGEQSRVGYRFFETDDRGNINEFYWRGLQNKKAYLDLIRQIALFIISRIGIMPAEPLGVLDQPVNDLGKTVFIAVAAGDLKDARQRLVNDLKSAGFGVVPEDNILPETCEALEQTLQEGLNNAECAVHLIGENRGITVEGSADPVTDQQLRLVRGAGVPRILWVPRWLPNQKDKPRDPFEVLSRFGGLQQQEEMHHGEVTDLSQWLRQRLQTANDTSETHSTDQNGFDRILVAAAQEADEELVVDLANRIQLCGFGVQPYYSDDTVPSVADLDHTLVIVPWGQASGVELESMLERLSTAAQTICLRLPGGDEKAKRRFFRTNIVCEKIDVLPGNRNETKALLDTLDITPQRFQTAGVSS